MSIIPTINMIKTGERITQLRKEAGLSVRELQEIFGFATPQYDFSVSFFLGCVIMEKREGFHHV